MFERSLLPLLAIAALVAVSAEAKSQTNCTSQDEALSDPDLQSRLSKLQIRAECLRRQNIALSTEQANEADTMKAKAWVSAATAQSLRSNEIAQTEDAAGDVKSKINFEEDLGFGVGIGYSWGTGPDRVDEAELVNGIVRVKKVSTDKPRLFLEAHKFVKTFSDGNRGTGPFVSLQSGADDALSSWGIGWMYGVRDKATAGEPMRSWNIGVGYLWDADVQILGDGIVANQPLPAGETEIRYTHKSLGSLFVMFSRKF